MLTWWEKTVGRFNGAFSGGYMSKDMNHRKATISGMGLILFKGGLIGIANIIPGVSGGTFALILGIYERLLRALHAIDVSVIKDTAALLTSGFSRKSREKFMKQLIRLDFLFLASLGVGAVTAIMACTFLIEWMLKDYPSITLAFFIGLIIPSIAVPWRMMGSNRSMTTMLWMIPGITLTVAISFAFQHIPSSNDNLVWCFITGMIAISAMILPGISGSFVLLVMGQYENVLGKIKAVQIGLASGSIEMAAWIWLAVFAVGCVAGLLVFARLLGFLLKRYRSITLVFLIGLIIGSFWVLWPFKDYDYRMDLPETMSAETRARVEEKTKIRVATAPNTWPDDTSDVLFCLLSMGIGLAGAIGLNAMGGDEESDEF